MSDALDAINEMADAKEAFYEAAANMLGRMKEAGIVDEYQSKTLQLLVEYDAAVLKNASLQPAGSR